VKNNTKKSIWPASSSKQMNRIRILSLMNYAIESFFLLFLWTKANLGFFPKSGPKVFSLLRREKKYSRCVNIFCVLKLYRTWCHSMAVCDRLVTLNFIWHTDHLLRLRVYLFVCLNSQHFLFSNSIWLRWFEM